MEGQTREKLVQAAEAVARWEGVREIAEDIIAWATRDTRRFSITPSVATGSRIIYFNVTGAKTSKIYAVYGESMSEKLLKQIFEDFFNDQQVLIRMIKTLGETVKEIADKNIEELENQI